MHKIVLVFTRLSRVAVIVTSLLFNFKLSGPIKLRMFFERTGGAFIKLGQILALRQDLLSQDYIIELLKLLNNVPEVSFKEVENVFIEDMGGNVDSFFIDFNKIAVACGSVGQIYSAFLPDGTKVAVKIQRPGTRDIFEADFILVSFIAGIIGFLHIVHSVSVDDVVADFVSWTRRELDFSLESNNASIIYKHSSKHPRTVIPKQYPQFSTKRVLVQEFIEGGICVNSLFLKEVDWREFKEKNINTESLAYYLISDEMRQYFIDGFFHADPHPANLFFLPDDKLAYLDFGIVGESGGDRFSFLKILHGVAKKDIDYVCRNFLEFNIQSFGNELGVYLQADIKHYQQVKKVFDKIKGLVLNDLKKDIEKILNPWFDAINSPKSKLEQKSVSAVFFKVIRKVEQYGVYLPRESILFLRALTILDMVALQIAPGFDMIKALSRFFEKHPLEDVERMIKEGTHSDVGKDITSLTDVNWEFFLEYSASEREKLLAHRERLADLVEYYAEKYEEVVPLIKKIK